MTSHYPTLAFCLYWLLSTVSNYLNMKQEERKRGWPLLMYPFQEATVTQVVPHSSLDFWHLELKVVDIISWLNYFFVCLIPAADGEEEKTWLSAGMKGGKRTSASERNNHASCYIFDELYYSLTSQGILAVKMICLVTVSSLILSSLHDKSSLVLTDQSNHYEHQIRELFILSTHDDEEDKFQSILSFFWGQKRKILFQGILLYPCNYCCLFMLHMMLCIRETKWYSFSCFCPRHTIINILTTVRNKKNGSRKKNFSFLFIREKSNIIFYIWLNE